MTSASELKDLGNAAFQRGDFNAAVQFFTDAIKLDPKNHVLYSNRSGAYASLKQYQPALADAKHCIKLKPDWPKGYSRGALANFQLGDYPAAVAMYEQGLALDPQNAQLREGLKEARQRDPNTMVKMQLELLVRSVKMNPKFTNYFKEDPSFEERLTGILGEIVKDPTKNLQLAMAMCPDPRIRAALTYALHLPTSEDAEDPEEVRERELREREKQRRAEEERLKREKENHQEQRSPEEMAAESLKEEGNHLYKSRKFTEALERYQKAFETYPKEITYLNNKAAVYLEMGDIDAAIKECESILERRYELMAPYEKVAKVYARLAQCYKKQGNMEKCIEMYEKALVENNDRHLRTALADAKRLKEKQDRERYINPELAEEHILKGNDFFRAGDYPSSKQEYDEAVRRNPSSARAYANRAAALMKLLDLPGALQDADKSLDLDPKNAKVWARKANIHLLMKENHKALAAVRKGQDIDPESQECKNLFYQIVAKIQQQSSTVDVDEEQVKRVMADPEIQGILSDPQVQIVLGKLERQPEIFPEIMQDTRMAGCIRKLIEAGVVRLGSSV